MGTWLDDLLETRRDLNLVANQDPAVAPELDYVAYSSNWVSGVDVSNSAGRDFVAVGLRGTYSFSDGVLIGGSATLTSVSGGGFSSDVVGAALSGPGIPAGATALSVAGATNLTMSAPATATASGVRVTVTRAAMQDLLYFRHRGGQSPTIGVAYTPPPTTHRLNVSASDAEPAMGTMQLRVGPAQTGNAVQVSDSGGARLLAVESDGVLVGRTTAGGVVVRAGNAVDALVMQWKDSTGAISYGLQVLAGSNDARFRYNTNDLNIWLAGSDGSFRHLTTLLGFFGANATTKPVVAGSRASGAAFASLLAGLSLLGLATDNSTA